MNYDILLMVVFGQVILYNVVICLSSVHANLSATQSFELKFRVQAVVIIIF